MEADLAMLKMLSKNSRVLTQGIDHLWLVKEAEYANIDEILRSL